MFFVGLRRAGAYGQGGITGLDLISELISQVASTRGDHFLPTWQRLFMKRNVMDPPALAREFFFGRFTGEDLLALSSSGGVCRRYPMYGRWGVVFICG